MATLFMSGWEMFSADDGGIWDTVFGNATSHAGALRTGARGMRAQRVSSGNAYVQKKFAISGYDGNVYVSFHFQIQTAHDGASPLRIACLYDSASNFQVASIRATTDHKLQLWKEGVTPAQIGSDSTALSTATWHRIELQWIGGATDQASAWINGALIASGTCDALHDNATDLMLGIFDTVTTGDYYFDDVVVNDNGGLDQVGLPGDVHVVQMSPDGDGDAQQGARGGTDSGTNWGQVDENPPNGLTDYWTLINNNDVFAVSLVSTATAGIPSDAVISAVQVNASHAAASAAQFAYAHRLKGSSTFATGASITHDDTTFKTNGDTPPRKPMISYLNHNTALPWTLADLDATQIGVRCSDATPDMRCSALWLLVWYIVPPKILAADAASYAFAPAAAGLLLPRTVGGSGGSLAAAGGDATLTLLAPKILAADGGSLAVVGSAATLAIGVGLALSHFRFGIDNATESTHGWYAAEDVSIELFPGNTFLLRFCVQNDATARTSVDFEFQCRKNAGAWQNVTTTSSIIKALAVTALTNGGATTKRLSGTGTFTGTSGQTEDGTSGSVGLNIASNGNTETICGLQVLIAGVERGDLIEFRLTRDIGTLLDSYAVSPSILVLNDFALAADSGALTIAGSPAPLVIARKLAADTGALTWAGSSATLTLIAPKVLAAAAGSFALAGGAAPLILERELPAAGGALAVAGQPAGLLLRRTLSAGGGALAWAGAPAAIAAARALSAGGGALALAGGAAQLKHAGRAAADSGAWSTAAGAAALLHARSLAAGSAAYALAGSIAGLISSGAGSKILAAAPGALAAAGGAAGLLAGRKVAAAAGAYALAGAPAALALGRALSASGRALALSGSAAQLRLVRTLGAQGTTYAFVGGSAGLVASGAGSKVLLADPASLALAAGPVAFLEQRRLAALAGAYALAAPPAGPALGRRLNAAPRALALAGGAAGLRHGGRLIAVAGAYALAGMPAELAQTGVLSLPGEAGAYAIAGGEAARLIYGRPLLNVIQGWSRHPPWMDRLLFGPRWGSGRWP